MVKESNLPVFCISLRTYRFNYAGFTPCSARDWEMKEYLLPPDDIPCLPILVMKVFTKACASLLLVWSEKISSVLRLSIDRPVVEEPTTLKSVWLKASSRCSLTLEVSRSGI